MALVSWIGKPDHWTLPKTSFEEAQWVMAADEEALPPVTQIIGKRHISPRAALNAVDRYLLRRTLPNGLSPSWTTFDYARRVVVKAPASSASSGVHILDLETPENAVACALREMNGMPTALTGVVEQFVEGASIEMSGVRLNGQTFFFHPLQQHWTPDHTRIRSYERAQVWRLYQKTEDALAAIGLDDSAFSVEWRVAGYLNATLIEINPRPGDDNNGYFEALWDKSIAEQIEEWAQEVYRQESPETAQVTAQAAHG